jgi:intracellular sulfur oxidation DsrE/DsrF family protein
MYLLVLNSNTFASHKDKINQLLKAEETPAGVVFEVLTWEENTWDWAAPLIAQYKKLLEKKFPGIDIAIVSHGSEQFQLIKSVANQQPEGIKQLNMLGNEGVDIHVCGVHSGWEDVPASAYIDIVDVSPSGPAQINDYRNLGYVLILIDEP